MNIKQSPTKKSCLIVICTLLLTSNTSWAKEPPKTILTGQFNATYNYNLNNPPLGPGNNTLRVFDSEHNNFNFDMAKIGVAHSPNDWSKFVVDLIFGENVALLDSVKGGMIGVDEFGVEQMYVELTAPIGKGLTVKAGHFVTPFGYEVNESAYDTHTSRSLLFGFAEPGFHNGLLLTYPFGEKSSGTIGVANGWDVVGDNNKAKSVLAQVAIAVTDTLSFSLGGIAGPEQAGNDSNWRSFIDFFATWTPNDRWNFSINYDWGREDGLATCSGKTCWQGVALYAHFKPTDLIGLSLRGEIFQDDGSRLLLGSNTTVAEGTGTLHFYLGEGLETRLEIRHDHADRPVFSTSSGSLREFQDTVSTEILYSF